MSYDIYLRADKCPTCNRPSGDEPMSHDPTYNLTPLFDWAITGEPLPNPEVGEIGVVLFGHKTDRPRGLRILSGRKAKDTLPWLENALRRLRDPANRAKCQELQAPNGWGTHEDAIKVMEYLIKDAQEYPNNTWDIR